MKYSTFQQLKAPSMKFVRIYLCPGREAVFTPSILEDSRSSKVRVSWIIVAPETSCSALTYPLMLLTVFGGDTSALSWRHSSGRILRSLAQSNQHLLDPFATCCQRANRRQGEKKTTHVGSHEKWFFRMAQIRWLELIWMQKVTKTKKKTDHSIQDLRTADKSAVINV